MWVPFLRPFPGNEAHKLYFSGGPRWGVLGGLQRAYVDKVDDVFYLSLMFAVSKSLLGLHFPMWCVMLSPPNTPNNLLGNERNVQAK